MHKLVTAALVAILAGLMLVGALAGVVQLRSGLAVTGLHEPVVWGLYVVCFVYFVGVGAGALFVTSLALCRGGEDRRPLARAGAIVSLVSLMLAGMFITIDLGHPERAWMLATKAKLQSPLIWDFLIINVLLGVAAVYTVFVLRRDVLRRGGARGLISRLLTIGAKADEGARTPKLIRLKAGVMVLGVPVLYVLTTRVFATLRARPDWNTTALPLVFVISALLSGLAAICVALSLSPRTRRTQGDLWRRLSIGLVIVIVIDALISLSPFAAMRSFDAPPGNSIWAGVGPSVALELVFGMLLPLVILLAARKRPGVFARRWHIIVPAMLRRNLPLPVASYAPSLIEYAVSAGIAAFGILVVALLMRFPAHAAAGDSDAPT